MFKNNLQARFIAPVSAFVVLFVFGGALVFSQSERTRIDEDDVTQQATQKSQEVLQLLDVTNSLMAQQTRSSMARVSRSRRIRKSRCLRR